MFARSFRASESFTTFVVCVAIFTDILLQNLVVPVLPYALHTRIGLDNDADIQNWTSILLSSYSASLMVGSLLFGYIGDKLPSRRTPFILGLILVFLSVLLFALATSLWVLLVARILEGLSSAIVSTIGFTLLNDLVGREHLGKAMGYTSMALSFGLLIGPVIGGVLYEYCGYFQVYLPAFALVGIEVVLRLLIIEKEKPKTLPPSPPEFTKTTPFSNNEHPSCSETPSLESQPLLTPDPETTPRLTNAYTTLLRSPRFLVALMALFILNSIACGFDSTLTPYIHDAFNMHATHAAALFLALAIPMLLAPLAGWLTDRHGPKLLIVAGLALAVPPLSMLSLVSAHTTAPFLKLATLLAVVGLALALTMAPLRVEATLVVDEMEGMRPGRFGDNGAYGRAYGLVNTMVAAGGLVGPLYAGSLRVAAGWDVLAWCNGALSAGVLVLVVLITGEKRKRDGHGGGAVV